MKLSLLFLIILTVICFVQSNAQNKKQILTNEKVIKMTQAELDKNLIMTVIESSEPNFDISDDGLIQLKKAKVNDEVIALIYKVQNKKNNPEKSTKSDNLSKTDNKNTDGKAEKNNKQVPEKGISWSEMPIVQGRTEVRANTIILGESYTDSIYLPDELVAFRTAKKYKKLIMKVGVQDNPDSVGFKRFSVRDGDKGILSEGLVKPNSRPVTVEVDISKFDVITLVNKDYNGQPHYFVRFIDVTFIPND